MKPTRNYVLIKPVEVPEKTDSGIFIPQSSRERGAYGEAVIVALGPTAGRIKYSNGGNESYGVNQYAVGDTVIFKRDEAATLVEGLLVLDEHIVGVL